MKTSIVTIFILFILMSLNACFGDQIVVDKLVILKDGESVIYKLNPSKYILELTSSDGVKVAWIGSTCPSSKKVTNYKTACELLQDGQLVIENPTGFGMGASASVTIKLTKTN